MRPGAPLSPGLIMNDAVPREPVHTQAARYIDLLQTAARRRPARGLRPAALAVRQAGVPGVNPPTWTFPDTSRAPRAVGTGVFAAAAAFVSRPA